MSRNVLVGAMCVLVACGFDEVEPAVDIAPVEDAWRLEIDAELSPNFYELLVGGRTREDEDGRRNFANRGDVIVRFTGPPGRIRVEVRRFTFAADEADAAEQFSRLHLINLDYPHLELPLAEEERCRDTWWSSCAVRVAYDGRVQPVRLGADLRITLPADLAVPVRVITEDTTHEDAYLRRGNVCVQGANSDVGVYLDSGVALIRHEGLNGQSPYCSESEEQGCDDVGWDPEICLCCRWAVTEVKGERGRATIDVPPWQWAQVNLINADPSPESCAMELAFPEEVIRYRPGSQPAELQAVLNDPGPPAHDWGGHAIGVDFSSCGPVPHATHPDIWAGPQDTMQSSEMRGHATVCPDCLADLDCEQALDRL